MEANLKGTPAHDGVRKRPNRSLFFDLPKYCSTNFMYRSFKRYSVSFDIFGHQPRLPN